MGDFTIGTKSVLSQSGSAEAVLSSTVTGGRGTNDYVLIGHNNFESDANAMTIDNVMSSAYKTYYLTGSYKLDSTSSVYLQFRFRNSSSADYDSGIYSFFHKSTNTDSGGTDRTNSAGDSTTLKIDNDSGDEMWNNMQMTIHAQSIGSASDKVTAEGTGFQRRDSSDTWWVNSYGLFMADSSVDPRGIKLFAAAADATAAGNIKTGSYFSFYGLKNS